jgi:hypothetical protein
MAIKVKELKDDALLSVQVNKSYYYMLKNSLYYLLTKIQESGEKETANSLENIKKADYSAMSPVEQAFFTTTLMIAEIEKISIEQKLFDEKEILEPGDEGYVEPTQD